MISFFIYQMCIRALLQQQTTSQGKPTMQPVFYMMFRTHYLPTIRLKQKILLLQKLRKTTGVWEHVSFISVQLHLSCRLYTQPITGCNWQSRQSVLCTSPRQGLEMLTKPCSALTSHGSSILIVYLTFQLNGIQLSLAELQLLQSFAFQWYFLEFTSTVKGKVLLELSIL